MHQIARTRRRSGVDAHGPIAVAHRRPCSGLHISTAARAGCAGHPSTKIHLATVGIANGLAECQIARGGHHFDAILGNNAFDTDSSAHHQGFCVLEIQRFHLCRQGIDLM